MLKLTALIWVLLFIMPAKANDSDYMPYVTASGHNLTSPTSTQRFYETAHYENFKWSSEQYAELVNSIYLSSEHGLNPKDYHIQLLTSKAVSAEQKQILATDAYLTLAGHLLGGKVNPVSVEPTWNAKGRKKDLVKYLQLAINQDNIKISLDHLAPSHPEYQLLQYALARYRTIKNQGGWISIPPGETLKPGMQSKRVEAVRLRLESTNDIQLTSDDRDFFDNDLELAVKKFQKRTNLEPDGHVGAITLKKLNDTPQDRINQLKVNLERWRWLPEDMGNKHIRVNIANYQLEARNEGSVSDVHDVVVGRTYRQTPVFSANMTYLVFNPWWEVPVSLARQDLLPKFQNDPTVVSRLGYQILDSDNNDVSSHNIKWRHYSESNFPFRIRQKPGALNALGRVKLMFPNEHYVYLHDTPSRELFDKTRRDFSSGCIRVKNPIDLVEWVLSGDESWSRNEIDYAVESGKESRVSIKNPIPVHILYWTVVIDSNAKNIRFIDDIYKRDEPVLTALNSSFGD